MIYITGDTHGDWSRFSSGNFSDGKLMNRDDYVIVCGDFGIWHNTNTERWWLNWLGEKPFTLLFVDGNHENYNRLYREFKEVDWHGGKVHKIRENVLHLERGYVFDIDGKKFFTFGGARSHDIKDGILDPADPDFENKYYHWNKAGCQFRVKDISWWPEEMPNEEEYARGIENLKKVNFNVDYVITHCAPSSVVKRLSRGYESDEETSYFERLISDYNLTFTRWYFGHYHNDTVPLLGKFYGFYHNIERIE